MFRLLKERVKGCSPPINRVLFSWHPLTCSAVSRAMSVFSLSFDCPALAFLSGHGFSFTLQHTSRPVACVGVT